MDSTVESRVTDVGTFAVQEVKPICPRCGDLLSPVLRAWWRDGRLHDVVCLLCGWQGWARFSERQREDV